MESEFAFTDADTTDDCDTWVTLVEAAEMLEKSQWSLYTLVRKRYIESRRVGYRIYVELGSVFMYYELRELEKRYKRCASGRV